MQNYSEEWNETVIDTHIILWTLNDNSKLPDYARDLIIGINNDIYFSATSVWKTMIKYMSKSDKIHISGSRLSDLCRRIVYQMIQITDRCVNALEILIYPNKVQIHNTPLDRIMIVQAKADGLKFVTHDFKISFYEEDCVIWV